MEELALIFLLVGLGLVSVVLVTVGLIVYSWQRQRKQKVHIGKSGAARAFDLESVCVKTGDKLDLETASAPRSPAHKAADQQLLVQNGALCSVVVISEGPPPSPAHLSPAEVPIRDLSPQIEDVQEDKTRRDARLKPDPHQLKEVGTEKPPRPRTERMEKVQESENERLYAEYEDVAKQPVTFVSSVAQLPENMRKNRYYDILPYDYNRVVLRDGPDDYINASYIKDGQGRVRFIAAQGPIGESEEKASCVVCLTQCVENLRHKCAMYWPEYAGEDVPIDDQLTMNLYCYTEDEICFQREIWLEKKGCGTRKIVQWHFKEWCDATVPTEASTLLAFLEKVRTTPGNFPTLVHCSAGVGRTGVYIGLELLLDCLDNEAVIDVAGTVAKLRAQRPNMVQNGEQYVALYEVIALAIRKKTRVIG